MNSTNKLIIILIFSGLLLSVVYFFWNNNLSQPKKHQAIKIAIKQLSENNLHLAEVNLKDTYPAKEFTNKNWHKYYQAIIVDKKGQVLYLTQIPKQYLISRFTYPEYEQIGLIKKLNTDIDLFLPIYSSGNRLMIKDEKGNTLITVNLESLQ